MGRAANPVEMEDIKKVLEDTEKVLDSVVDARNVLMRLASRSFVENAWKEVKQELPDIYSMLESSHSSYATTAQALGNVGLSGAQLELKLGGFKRALDRFTKRGTLKLLFDLFKWINKFLSSFIAAVPGGEVLKEIKDAIEEELDDSDLV